MSNRGDDPRDNVGEDSTILDWSFQSHPNVNLGKGRHAGSNFRRAILDRANLSEGDFSACDFRKATLVEVDMMKSAFDNSDFSGADLRKAKLNLSNFNNCKFDGADLRGIRGKYAIWRGSNWWDAKIDEELRTALSKKWPKPD